MNGDDLDFQIRLKIRKIKIRNIPNKKQFRTLNKL